LLDKFVKKTFLLIARVQMNKLINKSILPSFKKKYLMYKTSKNRTFFSRGNISQSNEENFGKLKQI